MFRVFTFYIKDMNWVRVYHPTIFEIFEDALNNIECYEIDKCSIQYLSNHKNGKDVFIFSKKNVGWHNMFGTMTLHSIVLIVEI
jgi:hypothetical protein